MVSPIMLIAAALALAFLMPLLHKISKTAARSLSLLSTAGFLAVSVLLFLQVAQSGRLMVMQTAGFSAPVSINLGVGFEEGIGLILINLLSLPSLWFFLTRKDSSFGGKELALFFTLMMGLNGLIMTRDLFNLFVFMEVTSISLFGLLASGSDKRVFEGGFKYMIAGGMASALYLIGVAFLYQRTGSLNLDSILQQGSNPALYLPVLLLICGILVELKPFPANGWALDSYQSADYGVGAVVSALNTSALLLVLLKLLPLVVLTRAGFLEALRVIGGMTFLISNLAGMRQEETRRMLGYSSIAQTGLILMVLTFLPSFQAAFLIAIILLVNHALSKSALFWLSELIKSHRLRNFTADPSVKKNRLIHLCIALAILGLASLPPFPGFWAKWELIMNLQNSGNSLWVLIILAGSLMEAFYLFRWFLRLQAHRQDDGTTLGEVIPEDFPVEQELPEEAPRRKPGAALLSPLFSLLILMAAGILIALYILQPAEYMLFVPLAALVLFTLLDWARLPLWIKVLAGMGALGFYSYRVIPELEGFRLIFGLIFLGGSLVQLFVFWNRKKDKSRGLMPLLMGMIFSLGSLLLFQTKLGLFFSWELMTLTSFFLILRGKRSAAAGLRYILFSLTGAFLILTALSLSPQGLWAEYIVLPHTLGAGILMGLGLLAKMGALGLHIWLPASYAESEEEISSFLSSVLSKAGLFLLFLSSALYLAPLFPQNASAALSSWNLSGVLGWIGVLTALVGALMALFQEDIKYTLAYSSMSQIGYMILGFAIFSHLGWVSSVYLAVTHLLFKGLLFLAIAGVIMRTGTRMMYQMGGLIKTMPLSFISVLLAIIALSGVPPLTGFGGKWLLYSSLLARGWYLQAALAMFASGIAFLYLFRLIHSIFLGQPKPSLSHVKEAPLWGFIPQFVFMGLIMLFSMYPNLLILPIQAAVEPFFPAAAESVVWEGSTVLSSLGYWNGSAVMYVTIGVFLFPLAWLTLVQARSKRVKQFNIVFAAERPYKPETTHFAFNFFSHYKKALGFLLDARTDRFWSMIGSSVEALAGAVRRIYSGNAQIYALYILLFVLIMHLLSGGTQ